MTYDPDVAIVLWPEYFDINRSRAEGRRLPKNLCVENPNLDILAKGAMMLDLEFEIKEDKAYPKAARLKHGCIKIEKGKMSKSMMLPEFGKILIQNQSRRSPC